MARSSIIAPIGLLLAFGAGWMVGRAGGSSMIPSRLEVPAVSAQGGDGGIRVIEPSPTPPEEHVAATTIDRLRVEPACPPPAEPAPSSPDAEVLRRELTQDAADEHRDLIRSSLTQAAQGLTESCYVELRNAMVAKLSPDLDGTDQQRAHAAIDAFVEAEYRYRARENTVLFERIIWRQPPSRAGRSGVFQGRLINLTAGSMEFEYLLNLEEEPQLANAQSDRSAARRTLDRFLSR